MMNEKTASISNNALAGLLAGGIAGLVFSLLVESPLGFGLNLAILAILGLVFGLVVGPGIHTPGTGLVWGEAYGLFWWLLGSLTLIPLLSGQGLPWTVTMIQDMFPLLLGQIVGYGAVLGLGYYLLAWGIAKIMPARAKSPPDLPVRRIPVGQAIAPPLVQAIIIGGLGGLIGSWVFAQGIERAEFFPLVAGIMGSNSMAVAHFLHYLIGIIIGISFGVLFHRDIRGAGSGLIWGLNYGLVWWIIGPLTLLPLLLGGSMRPDWSLTAAQHRFSPLVAHMIYGPLVGLVFSLVDKCWRILFVDSDPLNRTLEGAGARGLRALLMGQAGGIVGALLFTIVMVGIGFLPEVASLVGMTSALAGFIVHLIIGIIIGSSYGLLFQRQAYSYGSGLAWGLVYGLLWWMLGQLTLFFIILRQPVDWSLETAVAFYPSLVGHLLYGAGLGLFYQFLARRYDDELSGRVRRGTQGTRLAHQTNRSPQPRTTGTPAPALWAVTLVLGVLLPVLLSMSN
jgi:uncharacterized membrane protein YagU involved in acid resistance